MNQLKKIKLINWYMFTNETIEIEGHTLITGENASGKSTIMDAIQYVLTVGKVQFNKAANEKAKRNLSSYVHGKIGSEERGFLRDSSVVTYVVLEYDTKVGKQSIGVCLESESPRSGSPKPRFFKVDTALSDKDYLDDKTPKRFRDFKKDLVRKDIQIEDYNKLYEARNSFRFAMGVDPKYFEMVPRALAFRPLDDLNDFVYNYILEEKNVEIDSLRQTIKSLQDLQKTLEIQKDKRDDLKVILERHQKLIENENKLELITNVEKFSLKDDIILKINHTNHSIKQLELDLENLKKTLSTLSLKEKELSRELLEIEVAIQNNPELGRLDMLQKKIDRLKIDLEKVSHSHKQFTHHNTRIETLNQKLRWKYQSLTAFKTYDEAIISLNAFNENIKLRQNEAIKSKFKLEEDLSKLNKQLIDANNERKDLENNTFRYDANVTKLKELLTQELQRYFNEEVPVEIFSELLEIKDERWRNAVEGYLNTQRFNLIVAPRYYGYALKVYERYRKNIHGVGLVDVSKLEKYETAHEDSLANKVEAKSKSGELYKNYLMGNVICVETVEELNLHQRAITETCMVYSSHVIRAINPMIYNRPFIGLKAIEKRLIDLNEVLDELRYEINECQKEEKTTHQRLIYMNEILNINIEVHLKDYFEYVEIAQNLEEETSTYHALRNDKTSPHLRLLEDRDNLKLELENLSQQNDTYQNQKGTLEEKIKTSLFMLNSLSVEKKSITDELEQIKLNNHELYLGSLNLYNSDYKTKKHDYPSIISGVLGVITRFTNEIIKFMNEFDMKYKMGLGNSLESIENYKKHYHLIKDTDIRKTTDNIEEMKHKSEQAFQSEFISKLKSNIESARREIHHLNKNLKDRSFANNKYRFIIEKSKDDVFGRYFEIITSGEDYHVFDLWSHELSEANKKIMRDLFDKLATFQDSEINERELAKYIDYRNYMHYDIKISDDANNTYLYSKVFQEKSGGETQIPFYITIATSFEQVIDKKARDGSSCIVLFDEAFNNMDESRIKSMMEYYNSLNIQVIIAVPPNRLDTITDYVETRVTAVKIDTVMKSKSFRTVST